MALERPVHHGKGGPEARLQKRTVTTGAGLLSKFAAG
jgi:hypothetical protein